MEIISIPVSTAMNYTIDKIFIYNCNVIQINTLKRLIDFKIELLKHEKNVQLKAEIEKQIYMLLKKINCIKHLYN